MALTTDNRLSFFRDAADEMAVTMGAGPSEAITMETAPETVMDSIAELFTGAGKPADAQQDMNAKPELPTVKQEAWKPQARLNNDKVAAGVSQTRDTATAMGQDAKAKLGQVADMEKAMKEGVSGGAPGASNTTLAGHGRSLAFEAAAVGAVGLAAGPAAAATLGGVMLARDAMKMATGAGGGGPDPRSATGPSATSVTLKGQEARDARRGHLPSQMRQAKEGPTNSFEKQARAAETGYGRNATFDALAKGPGFGADPRDVMPRVGIAEQSLGLDGINGLKVSGSPEADAVAEHIKDMKAGFQQQLHIAQEHEQNLDAREQNGVKVASLDDLEGMSSDLVQQPAPSAKAAFVPGGIA